MPPRKYMNSNILLTPRSDFYYDFPSKGASAPRIYSLPLDFTCSKNKKKYICLQVRGHSRNNLYTVLF